MSDLYTSGVPVFSKDKITVVFVLGGPGSGQYSGQCAVRSWGAESKLVELPISVYAS